jgi:PAS domain S-box-containing protein
MDGADGADLRTPRSHDEPFRLLVEQMQQEAARKLAEERTARAQAERTGKELAIILTNVSDGVTAHRADGRAVYVNDAAARLCGFPSADEMLAVPAYEVLARFDVRDELGRPLPSDKIPLHQALAGRAGKTTVRLRNRRSGEQRWALISCVPVLGDTGETELVVSVFNDLTERKRQEDAWRLLAGTSAVLGSSLGYESTVAQVARLGVPEIADWCLVDVIGSRGEVQQVAAAHAGALDSASRARSTAPAGADPELASPARSCPPLPGSAIVARVLRTGKPVLLSEITAETAGLVPDAGQRDLVRASGMRSLMVVPLAARNRTFGAISFAAGLSGRRYRLADLSLAEEIARRASLALDNARAYREAHEAVRARDTFLSIASHELKTPLSSLTLLVSSLARGVREGRTLPEGRLAARLTRIEDQADRLTDLINQLLDVSRLAAGRFALAPATMDLGEVAREVATRFAEEAARAGATISVEEPGPLVGVWDRSRIDQIITNLLANALKYGGGTPVTVSLSPVPDGVRISVRDQGPGIAVEDQARIFEQYERAASANLGGLGLGLWIVRHVAQAHGGRVSLSSGPGAGAAFHVWLPWSTPAPTAAEEAGKQMAPG